MQNSRRSLVLLGAMPGLALASALARDDSATVVSANSKAELDRKLELQRHPSFGGEWAPRRKPTPKKGKATKAEKKAAKRERIRARIGENVAREVVDEVLAANP